MRILPRRLDTQLIFLVTGILLSTGVISGWVASHNQSKRLLATMRGNSAIMVKNLAASAAHYLVLQDFAGLESYLLTSAELPDVARLQVCEPDGTIIGNVERSPGMKPRARPDISQISPPSPPSSEITFENDTMLVWEPIEAGNRLGWVKATYVMASIREAQEETWKESLLLALIWAACSGVSLLIVLRPAAQTIKRLCAFARRLDESKGDQIGVASGTTEMEELSASLNFASSRLFSSEQQLIREREHLRITLRSIHDGVIAADASGTVVFMNSASEELTEWSTPEATGRKIDEVFRLLPEPAHDPTGSLLPNVIGSGSAMEFAPEAVLISKSGSERSIAGSVAPIQDDGGKMSGMVIVFHDVGEQRRVERKIRQLAAIVQSSDDAIIGKDLDGTITSWNRGAEKIYGYSDPEMIGRSIFVLIPQELHDETEQILERIRAGDNVEHFETVRLHKDGTRLTVAITVSPIRDGDGKVVAASTVARDITGRKHAEQQLALLNFALNNVREEAYLIDAQARLHYVNDESCRALGYSREKLLGMHVADIDPDFPIQRWPEHWRELRERGSITFEGSHRTRDGRICPVEIDANYFEYAGQGYNLALVRDITERKRDEAEFARVNRALRMLSDSNQALIRLTDEAALLNEVCRIAVEIGDYRLAWVAYAEQDGDKTLRPVAHAGHDSGYIESAGLSWADTERGRGPGGTAIRTGNTCLVRDIPADPSFAPLREEATRRGYRAVIALPLNSEGQTFGALSIYATEAEAFEGKEVDILKELAGDLAYGITALRTRASRDQAEEELKKSEEKFRTLIQKIQAAVVVHGADAHILTANPLAQELLGLTEEQLLGASAIDPSWHFIRDDGTVMPVDEYPVSQVLASQQALRNFTAGVQRPHNKEVVWVLVNADPISGAEGEIAQVIVTFVDITERKKAERALLESEKRYKQLLGSVTDYIYTVHIRDNRPVATVHGPGCAKVTGYAPEDYTADPDLWYRMVYEPDRAAVMVQAARIQAGEAVPALEHRIHHRDGSLRWVRNTSVPRFDGQRHLIAYDGLIADITKRKQAEELLRHSEQRYRDVFDNVVDGLYLLDVTEEGLFKILEVNPALERLTGIPRSLSVGKTQGEVVPGEAARLVNEKYRRCVEAGQPVEEEVELELPSGRRFFHSTLIPARDVTGRVNRIIGISRDITEHKQAERDRLATLTFFEIMDRVNRIIQGANALEQMMGDVLDAVLAAFDCDRAFLMYPCDPDAPSWHVPMERSRPEYPGARAQGLEIPMDDDVARTLRELLSSDRPVKFCPESEHPLPEDIAQQFGFRSFMSVAIHPKVGKPWQFGIHQCSYARVWTLREERLLLEIGRRLADALSGLLAYRDLQESEAKYRRFVDTSNEGIWVLGEDLLTKYVNARMADVLGYRSEDMIGRPVTDFMFDEDVPDHHRRMEFRQRGLSEHYESRYCHRNGQAVWSLVSAVPILDAEQHFEGSFAMHTDITDRKRTEQDLKRSENFLNSIVENIPNMLFVKDAESLRFVRFNKAGEQLLGYSRDELLGKNDYDLFPKEEADFFIAKDREVLSANKLVDISEEPIWTRDKIERILHTQKIPILDESGKPQYLLGISEDITERKKAEHTLHERDTFIRNILESVDEGFIVVDQHYRILSANRAFCNLAKLPEVRVVGRHCYEVAHNATRPCFESGESCPVKRTFETRTSHSDIHLHTDKTGAKQDVELHTYPLTDASGKVISVIETIVDITEKRKLGDQLRQAQKMEAIGTLAGGVAHDFNNILTAIIGYGSIVQMKMKPDDPQQAALDQILQSADRAAQLTHALLAFSRKQVIKPKPIDLNDIVKNVEKLLQRLIGEDVELSTRCCMKSLIAMADSGQIEQVLMNLATNARDAMPEGGVLTITTEEIELSEDFIISHTFGKPGTYALITISDTGIGMDEQTREKIFEPFFTTKEQGKGTGLGLAIVYGIVKQHEGTINVYSERGKGTTFEIYLPLIASQTVESHAETILRPQRGSETILLAEDDEAVRNLTKTFLADFGYRVIEAIDGDDAIEKYAKHSREIDLLIVDVIMPKKSGREVFDTVKAARPDANVLFISGYTADIIHKKGVFEEGIDFLSKPIKPFDLLRKIRAMLDKHLQAG